MGDDRGEQSAAYLEYGTVHEPSQYGPHGPHQVAPVGPYVGKAEQEGGDHQPKLLQHRAAEERLLAYAREDGEEHQIPGARTVHETRGEFLGDGAKRGKQPVSQKAHGDRTGRCQNPEEQARDTAPTQKWQVETPESAPHGRDYHERPVEQGGEPASFARSLVAKISRTGSL